MLLTYISRQFSRGLHLTSRHYYKLSSFSSQQSHFSTSSVQLFYHRTSTVTDKLNNQLLKKYKVPDGFKVIYMEPRKELNHMIITKGLELFIYCSPLVYLSYLTFMGKSLKAFVEQENFFIGIAIVFVYLLAVRFAANGFVKIMFYNPTTDVYRAFVLNKYKPTYKCVEFKEEELKVINLPPAIPMARNFFKAGKQHFIFHDDLFSSYNEKERLTANAIEKWEAWWDS